MIFPCRDPHQQRTYVSIACASIAWFFFISLFLCAVELHCCPKTIINISVRHTVWHVPSLPWTHTVVYWSSVDQFEMINHWWSPHSASLWCCADISNDNLTRSRWLQIWEPRITFVFTDYKHKGKMWSTDFSLTVHWLMTSFMSQKGWTRVLQISQIQ